MKRSLFGFALAALMIVSSCQKTPDLEPEAQNAELKKAQVEQSDYKIIPGQYIVVLNDFPGQPQGKAVGYASFVYPEFRGRNNEQSSGGQFYIYY